MHSIMFIVASQAKGIHQYGNVKNSLVRINILLLKINHRCGDGNNENHFLQKFNLFKGISHKAITVYTAKAIKSNEVRTITKNIIQQIQEVTWLYQPSVTFLGKIFSASLKDHRYVCE
jgi:hypothetical protein